MNDQMGYSKLFDWLKELMQWFYQEMLRGFLPRPLHRGDPVRIL